MNCSKYKIKDEKFKYDCKCVCPIKDKLMEIDRLNLIGFVCSGDVTKKVNYDTIVEKMRQRLSRTHNASEVKLKFNVTTKEKI